MLHRLLPAFIALAAAGAVPASAAAAAAKVVRRTFELRAGGLLKIDAYHGSIDVEASDDGRVHLEIDLDPGAYSPGESERILKSLQLEFREEPCAVVVTARNPAETGMHLVWKERSPLGLDFRARVPPACSLDLFTGEGEISVDDLAGRVSARVKMGIVFLRHIDGDVSVAADAGDVVLSGCTGSADIRAVKGGIRAGTVRGRADLRSTDGDIELQHAFGGGSIAAEVGDVIVGIPEEMDAEMRISTNGGAITVRLDPAARCDLKASSVWGRVHTKLPFVVESGGDGKKSLIGRLNGGGALLAVHADGGQVSIVAPP